MRLLLQIAMTHVLGRARQSLVSIAGVTLGVGFAIAMAALMQGSQKDFVETLIDAMPHVQITDERRNPPRQPADRRFDAVEWRGLRPREDVRGILNPTAAIAALESWVPGSISAGLNVQGVARYGGTERGVSLKGIHPQDEIRVSTIEEDMTHGSLADLTGAGLAAVIGEALAKRLSVGVGDRMRVTAAGGTTRQIKIVGLFRTGVVQSDEVVVYVDRKTAEILSGRLNALNEIRIRLSDADRASVIAARIEDMLGYKSVSWQEANESILEAFQIRNIIMYTVVAAILIVAGFGIYNIVSIITHEKSRDIAILKSLGFRERDVRLIFLSEGALMGLVGAILGGLLGFALTKILGTIKFQIPNAEEETYLPVLVNWMHYAIAGGFAIGSASIAGYLPARKAAQGNPVDIIRGAT